MVRSKILAMGVSLMTMVLLLGTVPLSASAAGYHCGSQCNGKSPSSPISNNGIVCKNSARQIAAGHPSATYDRIGPKNTFERVTEQDSLITVKVMYSSVCQTMWAVVTNAHGGVPLSCSLKNVRTASPTWSKAYACPAVGATRTYPMVNDYVSSQSIAAKVTYSGSLYRQVCVVPDSNGINCQSRNDKYPVAFTYTKSY